MNKTTPETVRITPSASHGPPSIRPKRKKLPATVTSGYMATSGETSVTGPFASAAYISRTASPLQKPTPANHSRLLVGALAAKLPLRHLVAAITITDDMT